VADQIGREFGQPFQPILRVAVFEDDVLPFNPSQLLQSLGKSCIHCGVYGMLVACAENAYRVSLPDRLRARPKRPCDRNSNNFEEISPAHVTTPCEVLDDASFQSLSELGASTRP
jgi:hypothetical protein